MRRVGKWASWQVGKKGLSAFPHGQGSTFLAEKNVVQKTHHRWMPKLYDPSILHFVLQIGPLLLQPLPMRLHHKYFQEAGLEGDGI